MEISYTLNSILNTTTTVVQPGFLFINVATNMLIKIENKTSFSWTDSCLYLYHYQPVQTHISCKILCGSLFPPSRALSYIPLC